MWPGRGRVGSPLRSGHGKVGGKAVGPGRAPFKSVEAVSSAGVDEPAHLWHSGLDSGLSVGSGA